MCYIQSVNIPDRFCSGSTPVVNSNDSDLVHPDHVYSINTDYCTLLAEHELPTVCLEAFVKIAACQMFNTNTVILIGGVHLFPKDSKDKDIQYI